MLGVAMRRWYVFVAGLALTAYLVASVPNWVSVTYSVNGAVLLIGPSVEEVFDPETGESSLEEVNPLLRLGGALGQIAETLALQLQSERVRSSFWEQGLDPEYFVGADARSPTIQLYVENDDPDVTRDTMEALMRWMEDELAIQQAGFGVDETQIVSLRRVSFDNQVGEGLTAQRRAMVLILGSGGLLTLMVAVAVDGIFVRRKIRRDGIDPRQRGDREVVVTTREPAAVSRPPSDRQLEPAPEPSSSVDNGSASAPRGERWKR